MFDWDEVRQKLKELKTQDPLCKEIFGANLHRHRSMPVSEAELLDFEARLGFPLPADYREFLKQIGYGAGPAYGLFSPQQALDETLSVIREEEDYCLWTPDDHGYGRLLHFEDLKWEHVALLLQKRDQGDYKDSYDIAPQLLCCYKGAVLISHVGSGIYSVLLGKGELAGTMWSIMPGELPVSPEGISTWPGSPVDRRRSHLQNFEEWYMDWLNQPLKNNWGNFTIPAQKFGRAKTGLSMAGKGLLQKLWGWIRRAGRR